MYSKVISIKRFLDSNTFFRSIFSKIFSSPYSLLFLAVFLQAIALALDGIFYGGKLESFLFLNIDLTDIHAKVIEKIFLTIALAGVFSVFFNHFFRFYFLYLSGLFFIVPVISIFLHSSFDYPFSVFAHAIRYILPLCLFMYLRPNQDKSFEKGAYLLRLGLSLTFIAHGFEALFLNPKFIDYLITFFNDFLNYDISENNVHKILFAIAIIDIFVGLLLVFKTHLWLLLWLAFWGGLTALWRLYYYDFDGELQFLLRSSHWLVPIFLIFHKKTYLFNNDKRMHDARIF